MYFWFSFFFSFKLIQLIDSKVIGIRVSQGPSYNQGLVEINKNNIWGTTCYSSWRYSAAQVACRQLGFADTQLSGSSYIQISNKNFTIVVGAINCSGNEANLNRCLQSNQLSTNNVACISHSTYRPNANCVGKSVKFMHFNGDAITNCWIHC